MDHMLILFRLFPTVAASLHLHLQCFRVPIVIYMIIITILVGRKWNFIVIWSCISRMVNDVDLVFIMLANYFNIPFGEASTEIICQSFNWVIFLYVGYKTLYISHSCSLLDMEVKIENSNLHRLTLLDCPFPLKFFLGCISVLVPVSNKKKKLSK